MFLYSKSDCVECDKAKRVLDINGISYEIIDVQNDTDMIKKFIESGHRSLPVFFVDGSYFSGIDSLLNVIKKLKGGV